MHSEATEATEAANLINNFRIKFHRFSHIQSGIHSSSQERPLSCCFQCQRIEYANRFQIDFEVNVIHLL